MLGWKFLIDCKSEGGLVVENFFMEYLVLLGGGRSDERLIAKRTLRDIRQVLEPLVPVKIMWLDEHGGMWIGKGDGWQTACINQGMIFETNCQEMVIGKPPGERIQQVWPVVFGKSYGWSGIASIVRFGGCRQIGTSSILSILLRDNQIASRILTEYSFAESGFAINKKEWMENRSVVVENAIEKLKFPIEICAKDYNQRVSLPETLENFLVQIFEDENDLDKILLKELVEGEREIVIGFVGRKNWLPSKSMVKVNQEWDLYEDVTEGRLVQDMMMDFVSKYDVSDYGLFYLKKNQNSFFIDMIELFPDLSRQGTYAKVWQKSGLEYDDLIKKIYMESIK